MSIFGNLGSLFSQILQIRYHSVCRKCSCKLYSLESLHCTYNIHENYSTCQVNREEANECDTKCNRSYKEHNFQKHVIQAGQNHDIFPFRYSSRHCLNSIHHLKVSWIAIVGAVLSLLVVNIIILIILAPFDLCCHISYILYWP